MKDTKCFFSSDEAQELITMAEDVSQITLKQILDICKTLKNIVCRSFGPRCNSTLLSTSSGQIMVTTDGIKLLQSLNIAHPIGRLIVNAVSTHHQNYADGVKTFMLYLTELLCQISVLKEKEDINLVAFSKLIPEFSEKILPECLELCKCNGLVILDSRFFPTELDFYMTQMVKTVLMPHLQRNLVIFISKLISNAIMNGSNTVTRILNVVHLFCDNVEKLHIKVTAPYKDSKLVSGILFRNFACHSHDSSKSVFKFVILRNSITGSTASEPDEIVRVSTEESVDASLTNSVKVADEFLQRLKSLSIDLILMSEKLPVMVVTLCRKYQISVIDCLDDQDMNLVETLSSTLSLSSVFDKICSSNIGETVLCEKIKFGKRIFANLHFKECLYLKSFVLCAPTDGLCHELWSLVYKSFKTLQMSVHTDALTNTSRLTEDILVDLNRGVKTETIDKSLNKGLCKRRSNLEKEKMSRSNLEAGQVDDDLSTSLVINGTEKSCLNLEVIGEENSGRKTEGLLKKTSSKGPGAEIKEISDSILASPEPQILLIPAGGYFEFQLAKAIKNCTDNFKSEKFGSLGKIIAETLLSVPRALHVNLCQQLSGEKRQFIKVLHEVLNSEECLCLNSRGCVYSPNGENCDRLDSFNLKVAILFNVLQLIQQLLRLDFIIGVKS